MSQSIYDFTCKCINDEDVSLNRYRGRVLLIVNTASYCGFTPQYKGLEHLYRTYRERGLVVLGFPSNQYAEEPFDEDRISQFCLRNYGVTFPMMSKVRVNGEEAAPLFSYLKDKRPGIFNSRSIKWNFTKFLVDRHGEVVARFPPTVFPRYLHKYIEKLLSQNDSPLSCT